MLTQPIIKVPEEAEMTRHQSATQLVTSAVISVWMACKLRRDTDRKTTAGRARAANPRAPPPFIPIGRPIRGLIFRVFYVHFSCVCTCDL